MTLAPKALALLLTATLVHAEPVQAAPTEDHWTIEATPEETKAFNDAARLIEAEDYPAALPLLQALALDTPDNADVFNLLGFALRKTGDLAASATAYERALYLKPDHPGALEYQGELFLLLNDVTAAERNLERLQKVCASPCDAAEDLAERIATWRMTQTK